MGPRRLLVLAAALLFAASCSGARPREATGPIPAGTGQLVVVTTAGWDANLGTLRTYVRDGATWRAVAGAVPVTVGRNGSAWGLGLHAAQPGVQKREGDGRAPAGAFAIGTA